MSRLLVVLVVILVVLGGGLAALAHRAHERPTTHVEKAVDLANLQG